MTRLPAVTGQKVVSALRRAGFAVLGQRSSHVFLHHLDGRSTVVPVHRGEVLGPGLLLKIARDVEITREQLIALVRSR